MPKVAAKKSYDASAIKWLKGLEGVRARLSVYLGRNADSLGVRQTAFEIIGNALDEATNGYGDTVGVKVEGDTLTVFDNGRGIPTGPHPKHKGVDTLTILATEMHAGGKLDATDGNYNTSIGTNGMGLAVVNAASASLIIWSIRNGAIKKQSFSEGKPVTDVVSVKLSDVPKLNGKAWSAKTGTVVQWVWDKTVFEKGTKFDAADLVKSIKDMSWFAVHIKKNKRIPVKFIIENKKTVEIQRVKLFNYVQTAFKTIAGDKDFELMTDTAMEGFSESFDFVGAWSTLADSYFHSAVNSVNTPDGGTHLKGAMNAMFTSFQKLAKKNQPFRPQDLFAGFIGCFNLRIASPIFNGQGKLALTSPQATELAENAVKPIVDKWIRQNKESALKIVERASAIFNVTNDMKLQKQLAAALATKKGGKSLLPPNLIQSTTKNPMEREIFTVEGQSASGTGKKASDRTYQEVLPLRGKMLNVLKSSSDKMKNSQVIIDLLRSIGYDPKNPQGELRVGKIMVLSDPDPDGPLSADTLVPYFDDTGVQRVDTIEYLSRLQASIDKPIKIIAKTPQGTYQQANAIQVNVREQTTDEYQILLSNGATLKCTASHKWHVGVVAQQSQVILSNVNQLRYLAAPFLTIGDQIIAQNSAGFVTVADISMVSSSFKPYYCMTVPNFGNFLVQTTGTDGTITNVVSSNCHINSLILSLLWKTIPHLFSEGRIFLVNAPLFTYSTPKRKYYGSSLQELAKQIGGKLDSNRVTRVKGFAEMAPETLREVAFNPETRSLTRLNHPREYSMEVEKIMGNDGAYRTEMIGL